MLLLALISHLSTLNSSLLIAYHTMKKYLYKLNIFFLTSVFFLVSTSCFAKNTDNKLDNFIFTGENLLYFIIGLPIVGALVYLFVIKDYIKNRKIEEFCEKNNLTYEDEFKHLPQNTKINFISIDAGKDGECTYKNIMSGEKKGLFFIFCDFNFLYSTKNHITFSSPNYPLLIIKNKNITFPYFFLRTGKNLNRYKDIKNILGRTKHISTEKLKPDYYNHIHFYEGTNLIFDDDLAFSDRFVLKVEDEEASKNFFSNKIRQVFKEKANKEYMYEGNEDGFVVSLPKEITFEEKIKFFEENLRFFYELSSNINS